MANFLEDLSIYNAKAAAAISAAVVECNNEKANMMSSLKTTANDITLSEEIRLNALTALINLGNLLDIPLPPYFPSVTTYALTETFVGVHNDLDGLQGGAPGEYYHLTDAERTAILNKASVGDISWANLSGNYSDNVTFGPLFDAKQDGLVAPTAATYFLKVSGNVVSYDNNVYLSTIEGIEAGGELEGTYRNPNLSNAAVIGKVLTGFDPFASIGTITASDTILSAIEKLNANIDSVIANPSGVASVAFTNNAALVFTTTASPSTGAASLSLSLNTQTANLVLASPNATTGQPSFRSLVAADLPNSGVAAGTFGSSTVIPQIQVDAKGRITSVTAITAASGGQVNTITLAVPSFLGLSSINNTLPASPQIVLQLATQTANTVFVGPATGAAAAPTFRLLVEDDIPQLSTSKITNLTNILNNFLTNNLSDGSIWIGNTSNAAVPRVLSGDVTVSNLGVTAIGLAKVQYDMIQNVTSQTLLGNYELTDGPVQQVTLSGDFVLNSGTGVLSLAVPVAPVVTTKGDLLGHDLISQQRVPSNNVDGSILLVNNSATGAYTDLGLNWVTMSGDATITASGAITIANNAVTVGKIQQLPAFTVIGNDTSGTATPTALSRTELTALVEQFTTSLSGVVPAASFAPVAPNVLSDYFLNASGAWSLGGGGTGTVTSVGLTMPAAFIVTPSTTNPITTSGTFTVTGAGTVAQYIRGDGSLATFPTSGGGGSGVNYYLNGSVTPSPAVAGYNQMSRVANTGAAANFTVNNTTGFALMAQFVTDANDPALLNIPAGAWDFNFYFNSSNNTGNPQFYVDLLKYDGTTFTPIATGIASAETITNGTTVDLYTTAIAVPSTVLTLTDRLVIRVYVDTAGSRTITFYTQATRLAEVFTTFTTGLTALNGLTAQVQLFANGSSGTAPAFVSSTATHTLNIPLASASSVTAGLISKTDYDSFAAKMSNPMTAVGDIIYGGTVTGGVAAPQRLAAGADGLVLKIVSGLPSWQTGGGGDVSSNTSSTTPGNLAVFADASGKLIGESSTVSLSGGELTLGVPSATTGSIKLAHSATTGTTTIQAAGNPLTAALVYVLPTALGSTNNVLSIQSVAGNTAQLAWAAAGTGNLTTTGLNQVVTGDIRFQSTGVANVGLVLRNNANTYATTFVMSSTGTAGTNFLTTFQSGNGTVPLLEATQSFSGPQTFTGGVTISTGGTLSVSRAATFSGAATFSVTGSNTVPQIDLAGATQNYIRWATTGLAAPVSGTTISTGTRILFRAATTATTLSTSIGIDASTNLWLGGPSVAFYTPDTGGVARALGSFGSTGPLGTGRGLTLGSADVTGPVLYIPQGLVSTSTYAYFDGFPTGNILPNGAGAGGIGSGTRIVLRIPGSGYAFSIGYDAANGIFFGGGSTTTSTAAFRYYSENVEGIRLTTASTAGAASFISVRNTAGNLLQVVSGRITGYGTPTGGNRGLSFAAVTQAEQVLAQLVADLKTHGLIG